MRTYFPVNHGILLVPKTYVDIIVLEAFRKSVLHCVLVLLLDNTRCGGEDAECALPLARIRRLAGLEEGAE